MIKLVCSEVVEAIGGHVREEVPQLSITGVSTDSRTVKAGELFFAISGPRFDGHAFVQAAFEAGAVGAVIGKGRAAGLGGDAHDLIEVDDVVAALGRLAAFHRRQLSADVIAVVGSNGKTTTKEMIDHILSAQYTGRSSPKSYNNSIGVPLTLLSAEASDDYLVVEIGTNAPGEIADLAELVRPDKAVVTCIGEEHLERLGDLAGVADEELSILPRLAPGGFAAVNIDNPISRGRAASNGVTIATFGRSDEADLRVSGASYEDGWLRFELNERFEYRLGMPGAHNARNAAGAIAVARRFGQEHEQIAKRLESFVPPPMRSEIVQIGGVTVINDAYNSNPHSAIAAIDVLESLPAGGRRIAVFGEMRELGRHALELHQHVAQRLCTGAVAHVFLVGRAAKLMADALDDRESLFVPSVNRCETVDDCAERLSRLVRDGDVILLKASRAVGLERLVEPLRRRLSAAPVV